MRAPASIGAADLLAIRPVKLAENSTSTWTIKSVCRVLLVQVKANKGGGPYANFRPRERIELMDAANDSGGEAWLVWWPPHGQCRWIPPNEWPT